jgi:hypothetical protein
VLELRDLAASKTVSTTRLVVFTALSTALTVSWRAAVPTGVNSITQFGLNTGIRCEQAHSKTSPAAEAEVGATSGSTLLDASKEI